MAISKPKSILDLLKNKRAEERANRVKLQKIEAQKEKLRAI